MGAQHMSQGHSSIYASMRNPSLVDFPGRMSAVFFTTGCNFRCGFCHNAPLLGTAKPGYTWEQLDELCQRFRRQWVRAAVLTGGEPTLDPNLSETLRFLRDHGFEVKLDTNGSRPDALAAVLDQVRFVAMDVKCSLPQYPRFVGCPDVAAVARSIALLLGASTPYEFRTTVIETVHTDGEMRAIGETVRGAVGFALQAFIPRDDLPDPRLRNTPRTRPQALQQAAQVLRPYVARVEIRGG
jgi:pyruvate formate lyase activating enzyme